MQHGSNLLAFLGACTIVSIGTVSAQAPAFCPVDMLMACPNHNLEKCSVGVWHGIDSLEIYILSKINETHISIKAHPPSKDEPPKFQDTIGTVSIRALDGGDADPKYCVKAPPAPTGIGNCTTHVTAFFSDANAILETSTMDSCGILSWKPKSGIGHLYGQWVHADLPKPSPPGAMCDFQSGFNLYREVGSSPPAEEYFTIENIKDQKGKTDQHSVYIHSVNNSFPNTTATVREFGDGTPGKFAWQAELYGGKQFKGIMRTNSAGGLLCCEQKKDRAGIVNNTRCPVLSWWAADGSTSCWSPVKLPAEPDGSCAE
eukprot:UC4_evm5s1289